MSLVPTPMLGFDGLLPLSSVSPDTLLACPQEPSKAPFVPLLMPSFLPQPSSSAMLSAAKGRPGGGGGSAALLPAERTLSTGKKMPM